MGIENDRQVTKEVNPLTDHEIFSLLKEVEDETGIKPAKSLVITGLNENITIIERNPNAGADGNYNARALRLFLIWNYKTEYLSLNLEQLREIAIKLEVRYTEDDAAFIEQFTRGQTENWYWNKMRTGRVTASNFKSVCRTTISKPALSLVKQICWPENTSFYSKSTQYGCNHEKHAYDELFKKMKEHHLQYDLKKCGLIVHPKYPLFGASPDGISNCFCCGKGCVEIKCPFCLRDGNDFTEILNLKDPYIIFNQESQIYEINKNHKYFF